MTTRDHGCMVSVVIPTLNNAKRLESVLHALAGQDFVGPVEIIVVDNGSTDGTLDLLASSSVKVLIEREIKNPYICRNRGIEAAEGDFVVLLDSSCVPLGTDWLTRAHAALTLSGADVGVGQPLFEFSRDPPGIAEFCDSLLFVDAAGAVARGGAPGGCLFVRADVFRKHGLFPVNVRSNGDTIWTNTISRAGCSLVLLDQLMYSYPARDDRALRRKQLRVGYGNRQAWQGAYLSIAAISLKALWNMRPPSPSSLRDLLQRRGGTNQEVHSFAKLYVYFWIMAIYRGLGRLGIKRVGSISAD